MGDYESKIPSAVACFMDDFEACIAHLRPPVTHRRATRTNLLERLFLEERRRLKIIPNAFGEKAVLKLMLAAMTRAPSAGERSGSPTSNAISWPLSDRSWIGNMRPTPASLSPPQRAYPIAKYPAGPGLDQPPNPPA